MSQQLPPLTTLRSFEASARLLSFSKAADELHVTHGAVSRAVRHLEDHVGRQALQAQRAGRKPHADGRCLRRLSARCAGPSGSGHRP